MWPEGEEPQRYEWKEGAMIVPPNMWFHQHFNTGTTPARYLAFKAEGVAIRNAQGVPKAWISQRARRQPDRLRRRAPGNPRVVLRGAGEARPEAEHGQGLRRRGGGATAESRLIGDSHHF